MDWVFVVIQHPEPYAGRRLQHLVNPALAVDLPPIASAGPDERDIPMALAKKPGSRMTSDRSVVNVDGTEPVRHSTGADHKTRNALPEKPVLHRLARAEDHPGRRSMGLRQSSQGAVRALAEAGPAHMKLYGPTHCGESVAKPVDDFRGGRQDFAERSWGKNTEYRWFLSASTSSPAGVDTVAAPLQGLDPSFAPQILQSGPQRVAAHIEFCGQFALAWQMIAPFVPLDGLSENLLRLGDKGETQGSPWKRWVFLHLVGQTYQIRPFARKCAATQNAPACFTAMKTLLPLLLPLLVSSPLLHAQEPLPTPESGSGKGFPLAAGGPVDIGSRRELFVDNTVIGTLRGGASLHLFEMTPATTETNDVAIIHNADWEGSWCRFAKYVQDQGVVKAWYMGHHHDARNPGGKGGRICYAVSRDGKQFEKPTLGIFNWFGVTANNILFDDNTFKGKDGKRLHGQNFSCFIDTNPATPPEARYKGVTGMGGHCGPTGLYAMQSADGIRWQVASDGPIVSNKFSLDSPNQGFWDAERKRYAVYLRDLVNRDGESGLGAKEWKRSILVTFSEDFVRWTEPQMLSYQYNDGRQAGVAPIDHLYTNEIKPYKRAPHIYLGFPARFNGWVEPMFMSSRDGLHFYRWMEHPMIARSAPADRDKNRSNHLWQEMIELPEEPRTYSMYASENLGIKGPHPDGSFPRVRRFTIRKDGFVSVRADKEQGELLTKPLLFKGETLTVNYNARLTENGSVRVEILDDQQRPVPGFTSADCDPLVGDEIDATVTWKGRAEVRSLAGKTVHLRFVLKSADLFSLRFSD